MSPRLSRRFFALVWAMFVVKGLLYCAVTPLWEGFDEPFHLAYIQSLAVTHRLPEFGKAHIGADIAESTGYVPLPVWMPSLAFEYGKLSYRDYWQMDETRRAELMEKLGGLAASPDTMSSSDAPLYQVQHPPLYYALCVPVYEAMGGLNLVKKVFALRLFSVLLASLCVITVALAFEDTPLTRIFAGLMVLWPVLYIDIARVGNDSLGIALYSLLFAGMVRFGQKPSLVRAAATGVALGLGLLTKAYFLPAIPAVILFVTYLAFIDSTPTGDGSPGGTWHAAPVTTAFLKGGFLLLAIAAVIGGWWYVRSYLLYGSFSGLQESVYHASVSLADKIRAAFEVPWSRIVKHVFVSFCWVNGWSLVHLPRLPYIVFVLIFAGAIIGLVRLVFVLCEGTARGAPAKHEDAEMVTAGQASRAPFIAAVCLIFFFLVGVIYHEINAYAVVGLGGGPGGWYLYALVLPISFVVALGIRGLGPLARPGFVAAFVAIWMVEIYGFLCVLAPYYAGLAVPAADGWGLHFAENPWLVFSMQTVTRLLANKPACVSAVTLLLSLAYPVVHVAVMSKCVTRST
ncbi:MAG: hypothetical protein Kow0099_22090 [Candidatus Abyssubacteria bacterium]